MTPLPHTREPRDGQTSQASKTWAGEKVADFEAPTSAPQSADQQNAWQNANRRWWETHPMRYDWKQANPETPGERAWYEEIDRRFFSACMLPQSSRPFGAMLTPETLAGKTVLEIGVGMGSHAQLIAGEAARFVGIDLSSPAVAATSRRLRIFGAPGDVLQMDAEKLAFPDATFDLVWSWGVIHHSANTRDALEEIRRVLKPAGRAMLMVYHRAFVPWYIYAGLIRGGVLGGLLRHGSIHELVQSYTDGAVARYYSSEEWRAEIRGLFDAESIEIYGNRQEALPLPAGAWKERVSRLAPDAALRFWLTRCRQGTLLFSRLRPR